MDWLQQAAQRSPEAPALALEDELWLYGDLDTAATAAAAALVRNGIRPGDLVAFAGERTSGSAIAAWGIARAGGTAVVLDPGLPPSEALRRTRDAGVKAVWNPLDDGWRRRRGRFRPVGAGPPDPSCRFVVFTSGSGDRPRGVILTGATIAASAGASQARLRNGPADRWLAVLPMFHVGGLSILWRSARAGGSVRFESQFEPSGCARRLRSGDVTMASLVPTMLRRILHAEAGPYRGLRAVLVGGGPVDPELLRRALDAGIPALETYGTTETASQIATTPPEEAGLFLGSAGPPLDGMEVRIVDARDRPVPPGEEGRIWVRGAMVSPGYLGGTERAQGSWLATGDLGSLDRDGRLRVFGRADEVIVSGGENVAPSEVARTILDHPGVVDVRVLGEPDDEWGTAVVAEIVLEAGADRPSVEAWARRRLASYQVPKRWKVVTHIDRGWKAPSNPEEPSGS